MASWTAPTYSKGRVNAAGATFVDPSSNALQREMALVVINNWRSSHSFPLNTFQTNLRRQASAVDVDPTVAQRIKRLPSIRHKLERIPGMDLARMHDIGGCRAVLSSVEAVDELVDYYKGTSRIKHKLVREDPYIANPKDSGYRGVHLVYSYYSDRRAAWNGLRIEIQIRSRLQHAWATAVETVGTFTQQALKSSWGDDEWLRFFSLMSSALAMREGTPLVPGTPDDPNVLKGELRDVVKRLEVVNRLNAYGAALQFAQQESVGKGHIFLLELNVAERILTARSFTNAALATAEYAAVERAFENDPNQDAVLVTVESLSTLQRAYPNYFLDTTAFIESLEEAIA